jgi:hypothetical protein
MKKYLFLSTILLSISMLFAFKADEQHFKGYINDSMCAASKSDMGMTADRVKCVNKCIKGGASAVLVVGDKVYKIANQKAVLKYAGENVLVDGTLTADTIQVAKIALDK